MAITSIVGTSVAAIAADAVAVYVEESTVCLCWVRTGIPSHTEGGLTVHFAKAVIAAQIEALLTVADKLDEELSSFTKKSKWKKTFKVPLKHFTHTHTKKSGKLRKTVICR